MACSYVMVPLLISYLDNYRYGIWITVFSVINWFQFLDIGLGNGLRNKYAYGVASGNIELARTYVSTTYYIISIISICLLVIALISFPFVNWHSVFNVDSRIGNELNLLMIVVVASFVINFPLKIIISLLYGAQKSAFANAIGSLGNVFSLVFIYFFLNKTGKNNLIDVGIIYTGVPLILLVLVNFYFFSTTFKSVRPSFNFIKREHIKDLTGLGFRFFILQINAVILFSTNAFIIAQTMDQSKVTEYNVMFRLYNIPYLIFQILVTPYWSAFTNAYAKQDIKWIKKNMRILVKIFAAVTALLLLIFAFNKPLFHLWIGNKVAVNNTSGFLFVIYLTIQAAMLPFVNFINGTGKIKLQLYIGFVACIVNIPLSIFFIKQFHWGINGTIVANAICVLPFSILMCIQTFKILRNQAKGIWNE